MRRRRQTDPVAAMLRDIERRVLNDIDIRVAPAVVLGVALGGVVLGALAAGWSEAATASIGPVDGAAVAVLACHVATSSVALAARDFRWCCAATLSGGFGAWLAIATYWLHESGSTAPGAVPPEPAAVSLSLLATAGFAAASTLAWLTVVARPLRSSHPDVPRGAHAVRRTRPHTDDGTLR